MFVYHVIVTLLLAALYWPFAVLYMFVAIGMNEN